MELSKVRAREEIIAKFHDGQIIAIGGQTGQYMPERLIQCVLDSGARHLTIYSIDTSDPGTGVGRLIRAGVVDRIITTHVGTNPETNAQIQAGTTDDLFLPQGQPVGQSYAGGPELRPVGQALVGKVVGIGGHGLPQGLQVRRPLQPPQPPRGAHADLRAVGGKSAAGLGDRQVRGSF